MERAHKEESERRIFTSIFMCTEEYTEGENMITLSVCMIVKNEEKILARSLDGLKELADEIIIVDTGSIDATRKIALSYTDKVFTYEWKDDFADARNFSFSKATKDYIYVADADEIIDIDNLRKFLELKQVLLPEIDIVQMKYTNQLYFGTVYNYEVEYRPKLFKRLREFQWIHPIHESISLEPVIYDSEIEIIHMPEENHASRDFSHYIKLIQQGTWLTKTVFLMYAKELFISGCDNDFIMAKRFFEQEVVSDKRSLEEIKAAQCVLMKSGRIAKDFNLMLKNSTKNFSDGKGSAEVCFELGEYFYEQADYEESILWFYNAAFETECECNLRYAGDYPLFRLAECYRRLGNEEQANIYEAAATEWERPVSQDA